MFVSNLQIYTMRPEEITIYKNLLEIIGWTIAPVTVP